MAVKSYTNTSAPVMQVEIVADNGDGTARARKPSATFRLPASAASVNATLAKTGATDLTTVIAHNTTASLKYLKLYNKATAPTIGTDTPMLTIPLASNALANLYFDSLYFSLGLGFGLTGAAADADTTALAANDVVGLNLVFA